MNQPPSPRSASHRTCLSFLDSRKAGARPAARVPRIAPLLIAAVLALAALLAGFTGPALAAVPLQEPAPTPTPEPPPDHSTTGGGMTMFQENVDCLVCHKLPHLSGGTLDGGKVSLSVDAETLRASKHGRLGCGACHANMTGYPHKNTQKVPCAECHASADEDRVVNAHLAYASPRALTLQLTGACAVCHQNVYAASLRGLHAQNLAGGNQNAPVCVDCHTSHAVQPTTEMSFSEICQDCHTAVYSSYQSSAHGAVKDGKVLDDVPTCLECHGVHAITGPTNPRFRQESVETCLHCHEDQARMEPYGLPADLFEERLDNYHSIPINLFERASYDISGSTPVCSDCHNIHNVRRAGAEPASQLSSYIPSCQKCHANAGAELLNAGPAHTSAHSPAGLLIQGLNGAFTWVFLPLSVGMVGLYIALDVRRRWLEKFLPPENEG